jgi:arylsulfatase A-like enzyme
MTRQDARKKTEPDVAAPTPGVHQVPMPFGQPAIVGMVMGMLLGYVEGVALYGLQWAHETKYVSAPIIWISPLVNALLFGLLGLALGLAMRRFRRVPTLDVAVFLFLFLMASDVLEIAFPQYIARYAKIILAMGIASAATRWIRPRMEGLVAGCRRYLPRLAASLLVTCLLIQGGIWATERYRTAQLVPVEGSPPNVLMIVFDALRADHVSCYGYSRQTTPVMDALAERGVRFESSFSASSWTLPSHASLFTGLDAAEHGVGPGSDRIAPGSTTIAQQLRDLGYRTGAFSGNVFWVTHDRMGNGFLHFEDYFNSVADCFFRTMNGRAFEKFVLQRLGVEDIPARKRARDINRSLLRWIDRQPRRPFFAFVNYFDCHDPYLPPGEYRTKFSDHRVGGLLNWRVGRANPQLSDSQQQDEIDAYDGGIAYEDHALGELLQALRLRGLEQNTLVIVTSDHGEAFDEHGYYLHGHSLYLDQIQVPLVMTWPERIPSGHVVTQPVTNSSLPATIMELVGATAHPFRNPSLVQLWSGQATDWPWPQASTHKKDWAPVGSPAYDGSMACVLTPRWHLIRHEIRADELFGWRDDPREAHNVAKQDGMQQLIESLGKVEWGQ